MPPVFSFEFPRALHPRRQDFQLKLPVLLPPAAAAGILKHSSLPTPGFSFEIPGVPRPLGSWVYAFLRVPQPLGSWMYAFLRVPRPLGSWMYAFLHVLRPLGSWMHEFLRDH